MHFLDKMTSPSFVKENVVLGDVHMLAAEKFCITQMQGMETFLSANYKVGDTVVIHITVHQAV